MKTSVLSLVMLLACSLLAFSQQKQQRRVDNFDKISIRSAITAYIRQGDKNEVTLEGDSKTLEKVITEVQGEELIVRRDQNWGSWNQRDGMVTAYITVKSLKELEASGASTIRGETDFKTSENFELEASGASKIELDLSTRRLKTEVSGASKIELKLTADEIRSDISGASTLRISGKVARQEIEVSGASTYKAGDVESKRAEIDASGASSIEIWISDEIIAELTGASNLRYKGNPSRSETYSTGGSSVKKIQF
jgi:hypothetical protein